MAVLFVSTKQSYFIPREISLSANKNQTFSWSFCPSCRSFAAVVNVIKMTADGTVSEGPKLRSPLKPLKHDGTVVSTNNATLCRECVILCHFVTHKISMSFCPSCYLAAVVNVIKMTADGGRIKGINLGDQRGGKGRGRGVQRLLCQYLIS